VRALNNHEKGESIYMDMGGGTNENPGRKPKSDALDIIAMIIAGFQIVLPPLFMIFGAALLAYFLLKLAARP
jgi:hypothetical protein